MNNFGKRLSELLEERNLKQRDLARQIGCTEATMSRYVNNKRVPKATEIIKIAKALNVSADMLLGLGDKENTMSVSKYRYTELCDGQPCPGDCDLCGKEETQSNDSNTLPNVSNTLDALDLISRRAAIDLMQMALEDDWEPDYATDRINELPSAQPERPEQPESAKEYCNECDHVEMCRWYPYEGCEFRSLPSAQPEIVRCKDCRWWDKFDNYDIGYCIAAEHGYLSEHWEIRIRRTYKGDFYCADAERRTDA